MTDAPSEDEFAAWKAQSVTAWVLESARLIGERQREDWADKSWADAPAPNDFLIRKRAMAAAYGDLANITREACMAAHGEVEDA